MIRAGFVLNVTEQRWLGGQVYFMNLFGALSALPEHRVIPVALSGSAVPADMGGMPSLAQARLDCLKRGSLRWLARRLLRRFSVRDPLLESALLAAHIDLLSHSGHLGPKPRLPTLAWIPDFQHVHMPAFFSPAELGRRDSHLSSLCRYATRLVLSSRSAQNDLARFCPEALPKSRVLQFVADIRDPQRLPSRQALEQKYRFSGPYFFLPNQFWAHKNHRLVLDALAILRARHAHATVIATGTTRDDRNPGYFDELMQHARSVDVAGSFRVLGVIPRDDVMALMWHAQATINPSRFEGWSTTVEEAKSLGVKILVSDIEVHREQAPPGAAYFHPDDSEALANLMQKMQRDDDPEETRSLAERARTRLPQRRAAFARLFEDYALECVQAGPGTG